MTKHHYFGEYGIIVDTCHSSSVMEAYVVYEGGFVLARFRSNPTVRYHYKMPLPAIMRLFGTNMDSAGRFIAAIKQAGDLVWTDQLVES